MRAMLGQCSCMLEVPEEDVSIACIRGISARYDRRTQQEGWSPPPRNGGGLRLRLGSNGAGMGKIIVETFLCFGLKSHSITSQKVGTRWVLAPGHAVSITPTYLRKASKNSDKSWCPYGDANSSSTTTLHRTAVGNIESRRIDASIPAVVSSDMQIRTRSRGQPTEVPPRSLMQR